MPLIDELENGKIYKLINVKLRAQGVLELDDITNLAFIHYFVGSPSQQWQAIASNGFWKLKNVETGLYLGTRLGGRTNAMDPVIATKDEFRWSVEKMNPEESGGGEFRFNVPYAEVSLDANTETGAFPETRVKFCETVDSGEDDTNQCWMLDTDVQPVVPLEAGYAYRVVHAGTGMVAHLESKGQISGYEYNQGPNQLWKAIPEKSSPFLWAFKSISDGRYMGIREGDLAESGTRVEAVEGPFLWHIVCTDLNRFRLFVPYTNMSVELHPGLPASGRKIQLSESQNSWIFEKDSDLLFRVRSINPGPPDF